MGGVTFARILSMRPSTARLGAAVALGLLVAWYVTPVRPTLGGDGASLPGVTYHVREDGGDPTRCSGLVDAPDPGVGRAQPCAWDHPFRALPPGAEPRIDGGDTLVVHAGSYRMGFGAPGADSCEQAGSFDCLMSAIPSGPDADHPTRILGAGWDDGCGRPPELWGSGRPWFDRRPDRLEPRRAGVPRDHRSLGLRGVPQRRPRLRARPPTLWRLGCHRPLRRGLVRRLPSRPRHPRPGSHRRPRRAPDATGRWRTCASPGNGLAGWDGDLWDEGGDANSGTMRFRRWTVEWNGCGETYPGGQPTGCWAQEAGGYGDGVGTGATGGDWIIEDSAFLHNTSDGLDLLYHSLGGRSSISRVPRRGQRRQPDQGSPARPIWSTSVVVGNCALLRGPALHVPWWTTAAPTATRSRSPSPAARP